MSDTGGLGQPGQRVIRHESAESDLYRVLKTTGWLAVCLVFFVVLTFAEILILGPFAIFGLGVLAIMLAFGLALRQAIKRRKRQDRSREQAIAAFFVLALVAWGASGYDWLLDVWPPYRVDWPAWAKLAALAIFGCVQFALVWGSWRLWAELVDPTGPTAPRAAVARDRLITPWTRETHGGAILPEPEPEPVYSRVVEIVVRDRSGRKRKLGQLADHPGLPQLAKAIAGGQAPTERMAHDYGYSRRQWVDFRDIGLSREWLAWRNGQRQQGLYATDDGQAVYRELGRLTAGIAA